MENSLELGVPVVVEFHIKDSPEWYKKFILSYSTQHTPLEQKVVILFNNKKEKVQLIFPTQHHYTMFLLKWS